MSTKFDIEKFEGNMIFSIWRIKMKAILTHPGLQKTLLGISNMPIGGKTRTRSKGTFDYSVVLVKWGVKREGQHNIFERSFVKR